MATTWVPLVLAAAGLAVAATSGCSGELGFGTTSDDGFLEAGEELIEGELADQIGLGLLDASCSGSDLAAGDTFTCSASADGVDPIEFVGTIDEDGDEVNIASANLLLAEQVEQVEAFAASLIEESTGQTIGAENFECADTSVVVSSGEILACRVTDPSDGTVYQAPVTVDDLESLSITVNVGDPIE